MFYRSKCVFCISRSGDQVLVEEHIFSRGRFLCRVQCTFPFGVILIRILVLSIGSPCFWTLRCSQHDYSARPRKVSLAAPGWAGRRYLITFCTRPRIPGLRSASGLTRPVRR
jgi:hypothetical protein